MKLIFHQRDKGKAGGGGRERKQECRRERKKGREEETKCERDTKKQRGFK